MSAKRTAETSVGYWLWESREAQGLSLEEIADATRIRATILRHIEEDQFENLPGGTYLTGYLKSYGRYLGLDPKEVIARFESEQGIGHQDTQLYMPQTMPNENVPRRLLLVATLGLCLVIFASWALWQHDARTPAPVTTAVPEAQRPDPHPDLDSTARRLPTGEDNIVTDPAAAPTTPANEGGMPAPAAGVTVEPTPVPPETSKKPRRRLEGAYRPAQPQPAAAPLIIQAEE